MQLELFDWEPRKRCPRCTQVLALDAFYTANAKINKASAYCMPCTVLNNKERYKNKKDTYTQRIARNQKARPHLLTATSAKRRARKLKATPSWLTSQHHDEIKAIYKEAKDLERLTGVAYHVDHIMPLINRYLCGLHVPWNLRAIPASENMSKSNRITEECFT